MPVEPARRVRLQLFAQERTESATPRRRQEARRKGQVARTSELSAALVLIAGFFALYLLASYAGREMLVFTRRAFTDMLTGYTTVSPGEAPALFLEIIAVVARVVAPVVGATLVVGVFSQVVQVGFLASPEPLKPRLERINPASGVKRILSKRAVVELLKAVLKVVAVGLVLNSVIRGALPSILRFAEFNIEEALAFAGLLVFRSGLWVGLTLLILAAFDYAYQRWEFEQSIKMSKQEVREELRQTEGDPQIRSKIRQRQRQIASARMMAQVPRADVVITNPVHLAVALAYDAEEMEAPTVVAKGAGPLARRIRETAREHGVAVVENVWLARALYETAELNARIPEELYQAVAEVLAFVYRLRRAGGRGA